jgi:hypothetical protein
LSISQTGSSIASRVTVVTQPGPPVSVSSSRHGSRRESISKRATRNNQIAPWASVGHLCGDPGPQIAGRGSYDDDGALCSSLMIYNLTITHFRCCANILAIAALFCLADTPHSLSRARSLRRPRGIVKHSLTTAHRHCPSLSSISWRPPLFSLGPLRPSRVGIMAMDMRTPGRGHPSIWGP